jgi:hypothetical protein
LWVFVYKSERASMRFRRHHEDDRDSLSKAFFKQSLVYLGAFYLTWPPYLALQVMIANGYAFSNYGFTLYAGTAVTLQGFWNYTFHVGLNGRAIRKSINTAWISVKSSAKSRSFKTSVALNQGSKQSGEVSNLGQTNGHEEENVPPL